MRSPDAADITSGLLKTAGSTYRFSRRAAKNQVTFNAPSVTVQLFPTVAEARGYLAQACRCWHTECQERHALASATLQPREQKRSMKRPVGLSREGLPHEVRHLAGDVWAYRALDRLYSFAELSGNLLWLVNARHARVHPPEWSEHDIGHASHQAILTAVGYDDSKVVVLDNGEIFHDYDDDADGDDSVESSDGDEDNGGVPTINCRFTAAAIAGQARGGDVWTVKSLLPWYPIPPFRAKVDSFLMEGSAPRLARTVMLFGVEVQHEGFVCDDALANPPLDEPIYGGDPSMQRPKEKRRENERLTMATTVAAGTIILLSGIVTTTPSKLYQPTKLTQLG
ncbi:hypothetical protein B0H14DRAFT_2588483 [Mycena olivaceomarginata]|nr:hypothetical protein B0H14DRAFT_2588483 [Mycena olivaceomarginata]